ncbi:hypothetical protein CY35_18G011100 [Sphagnum magellanicum]|nr:hypothetical protein CY35_18G011100 [Sphagnum magellanicum]
MAKGASSSKQEGTASTEQKAVEAESKRLLDLSFSRGVLSQNKAHPANPLRPSKAVLKCNGKDIVKKGHRKNKYLFAFPGLVAPVAGGKFGDLTQLDSKNPILYVDFPQGRLKLFGTIVYPKNKYLTLNFVRGSNIICEDCFESLVVFSVAWWIGTKDDNPEELRLEMPLDLQQEKHADFDFKAGAGRARAFKESLEEDTIEHKHDQLEIPKGQLTMDQCFRGNKQDESDVKVEKQTEEKQDSDVEQRTLIHLEDTPTPIRQSARIAGKKFKYTQSPSSSSLSLEHEKEEEGDSASDTSEFKLNSGRGLFTTKTDVDDSSFASTKEHSAVSGVSNKKRGIATSILMELSDEEEAKEGDLVAPSQNSVAKGIPVGEVQTSSVQVIASSGGGLKQSSLASFLFKPSEKASQQDPLWLLYGFYVFEILQTCLGHVQDPEVKAEQSHNSTETGTTKTYRRKRERTVTPQKPVSEVKGFRGKGKSPVKKRKTEAKVSDDD